MMKKFLNLFGQALVLSLLMMPIAAYAQQTTVQGGTGTSSPWGILYGDGTLHLKTVDIGSGLTFSGGTLFASGGSTASSTLLGDNNTFSGIDKFTNQLTTTGGITSNNQFNLSYSGPATLYTNTGAGTDNKNWVFGAGPTTFQEYVLNDTGSVSTQWLNVNRSGTTISNIIFATGASPGTAALTLGSNQSLTIATTTAGCVNSSSVGVLFVNPCLTGTVTSIATNNGLTGGTITTTGTIGLATINAGVLGAVTNGSVPTSQATSTLYGTGSTGQVLTWNGSPIWQTPTMYDTFGYPFPNQLGGLNATSTGVGFAGGFLSTASSTVTGLFTASGGASTTAFTSTGATYLATLGGNVGIGTTNPTFNLDVTGTGHFTTLIGSPLLDMSSAGANKAVFLMNSGGTNFGKISVQAGSPGAWSLGYGSGDNNVTGTPVLTWNENNNVGIGSSTPTFPFSVQGNSYISGTSFFGGAITATSTFNLTGLGTFAGGFLSSASSTINGGSLTLTPLGTAAGTFLAADPTGKIIATSTPSGSNSAFSPAANYATTGTLPSYTYVAGVITAVSNGALSVDGANPPVGSVVLVKNESGACTSSSGGCNNGLYNVTAAGSGIAAFVLTRNSSYNSSNNVIPGIITYVISGATNDDDFWALTSAAPITIGTTALTYVEVSGGGASVTSVTGNANNTLTISPTSGAVIAGINLTNPNIWTGLQQFSGFASTTLFSDYGAGYFGSTATTTINGGATSTFNGGITVSSSQATSTFDKGIQAQYFSLTGTTATSTAANGFNLTNGCFAVNGTCLGSSGGSVAGSGQQIQYNNYGSFGATNGFVYATSTAQLTIGGGLLDGGTGSIRLANDIAPPQEYNIINTTGLGGSLHTFTLPDVTGLGVVGTGSNGNCAQWNSTNSITNTTGACDSFAWPFTLNAAGGVATSTLVNFNGNASTTALSALQAFFGTTASSTFTTGGLLGIGTSTPFAALTLDRKLGFASSTIAVSEYNFGAATSTAETIDCRSATDIHFRIGTSATTLQINSSSMIPGQKCIVIVENPNAAAGAITWTASTGAILLWAGGTVPTQTTAANKMDVWSFLMTQGSSTNALLGAMTSNF